VGAMAFAETLTTNTSLQELWLANNSIGDAGVASLAEALCSNTTLTDLNLGCNRLTNEGASSLAGALHEANVTLQTLTIAYNPGVGDEGKDAIQSVVEQKKSEFLLEY
jgi:Ran GTPase-activating protein (RanGAP) involved in mRNA processing and transport